MFCAFIPPPLLQYLFLLKVKNQLHEGMSFYVIKIRIDGNLIPEISSLFHLLLSLTFLLFLFIPNITFLFLSFYSWQNSIKVQLEFKDNVIENKSSCLKSKWKINQGQGQKSSSRSKIKIKVKNQAQVQRSRSMSKFKVKVKNSRSRSKIKVKVTNQGQCLKPRSRSTSISKI